MKNAVLNNGVQMPVLGFGIYQANPSETQEVVSAVNQVEPHPFHQQPVPGSPRS